MVQPTVFPQTNQNGVKGKKIDARQDCEHHSTLFFHIFVVFFFCGLEICKKFQRLPKIGRNYGSMSVRMCTFTCVESDVITNFIPIKIKHLRSGEKNQSTEGKNVRNLIENYIFLVGLWQAGVTRVNRFL